MLKKTLYEIEEMVLHPLDAPFLVGESSGSMPSQELCQRTGHEFNITTIMVADHHRASA